MNVRQKKRWDTWTKGETQVVTKLLWDVCCSHLNGCCRLEQAVSDLLNSFTGLNQQTAASLNRNDAVCVSQKELTYFKAAHRHLWPLRTRVKTKSLNNWGINPKKNCTCTQTAFVHESPKKLQTYAKLINIFKDFNPLKARWMIFIIPTKTK